MFTLADRFAGKPVFSRAEFWGLSGNDYIPTKAFNVDAIVPPSGGGRYDPSSYFRSVT